MSFWSVVRSSNAFNLWHWTGSAGLFQCPFAAGACLTYFTYSRHLPQNSPMLENDTGVGPSPFSIPPAGGVGGVLRSSPAHSSVWYGMGIMALKRFSFFFGRRSPSLQTVAVWSMVESRMVAPHLNLLRRSIESKGMSPSLAVYFSSPASLLTGTVVQSYLLLRKIVIVDELT